MAALGLRPRRAPRLRLILQPEERAAAGRPRRFALVLRLLAAAHHRRRGAPRLRFCRFLHAAHLHVELAAAADLARVVLVDLPARREPVLLLLNLAREILRGAVRGDAARARGAVRHRVHRVRGRPRRVVEDARDAHRVAAARLVQRVGALAPQRHVLLFGRRRPVVALPLAVRDRVRQLRLTAVRPRVARHPVVPLQRGRPVAARQRTTIAFGRGALPCRTRIEEAIQNESRLGPGASPRRRLEREQARLRRHPPGLRRRLAPLILQAGVRGRFRGGGVLLQPHQPPGGPLRRGSARRPFQLACQRRRTVGTGILRQLRQPNLQIGLRERCRRRRDRRGVEESVLDPRADDLLRELFFLDVGDGSQSVAKAGEGKAGGGVEGAGSCEERDSVDCDRFSLIHWLPSDRSHL